MTQAREKCDSLTWVEVTFEWFESVMEFHVLIFSFLCLEPTVRKDTWVRTTSVTVMVISSNVTNLT